MKKIELFLKNRVFDLALSSAKSNAKDFVDALDNRVFDRGNLDGTGQKQYKSAAHKSKRRSRGLQVGFVDLDFTSKLRSTLEVIDMSKKPKLLVHLRVNVGRNYKIAGGVMLVDSLEEKGYAIKATSAEVSKLKKAIINDLRP
jgi:hypothetical protein